jgi:hypothetical protein
VHKVGDILLGALRHKDRFVDVNKMIPRGMPGTRAGGFRLGDDGVKVAPLAVAEQELKVARQPVFNPCLGLLGVALEGAGKLLNDLGFHWGPPP